MASRPKELASATTWPDVSRVRSSWLQLFASCHLVSALERAGLNFLKLGQAGFCLIMKLYTLAGRCISAAGQMLLERQTRVGEKEREMGCVSSQLSYNGKSELWTPKLVCFKILSNY